MYWQIFSIISPQFWHISVAIRLVYPYLTLKIDHNRFWLLRQLKKEQQYLCACSSDRLQAPLFSRFPPWQDPTCILPITHLYLFLSLRFPSSLLSTLLTHLGSPISVLLSHLFYPLTSSDHPIPIYIIIQFFHPTPFTKLSCFTIQTCKPIFFTLPCFTAPTPFQFTIPFHPSQPHHTIPTPF